MKIPENAEKVLEKLNSAGYEAYIVGGGLRDALMNLPIHDIDITTNARPEEIIEVFKNYKIIPTGLKHGTITILFNNEAFEITTYRIDGDYTDGRRPDNVNFTTNIKEDLARRDFTINAMALSKESKLIDPFGGKDDIKNKVIRCVGKPEKRLNEDALRILRAVRFASRFGFKVEKHTSEAIHNLVGNLDYISAERIREELDGILLGKYCIGAMLEFTDVITYIIPQLKYTVGFEQHSPYHKYTIWEHIVRSVDSSPENDLTVRRTMLFHDIDKPSCFYLDSDGRGHFKGHAVTGAITATKIMQKLKYDKKSIQETSELIYHHSEIIRSEKQVKRLISKLGEKQFFNLLNVMKADNSAKHDFVLDRLSELDKFGEYARKVISENNCMKISQLDINGHDLIELGFKGVNIGNMLNKLLELVLDGIIENNRELLLEYVKRGDDN